MKNIQLKYTCAAYPPNGINMNHTYYFGFDSVGYFYKELVDSQPMYVDIELIKMLFSPVESTWENVLGKQFPTK